MGRVKVEDLPQDNAVTVQIDLHQSALARHPERIEARVSARLAGPDNRELRQAYADWFLEAHGRGLNWEPSARAAWRRDFMDAGEFRIMEESLVWTSTRDEWLRQGMARGLEQGMARLEQARADERARLSRQAGRKFGERAAERLASVIREETDAERLTEVGDWIIDCDAEAEFLARLQVGGEGRV